MFENISSTLQQCAYFFAAGLIMGLFYEVLRFFRMLLRHNTVAVCIEDTLYMSICAFVSFIVALAVGIGYMRIYYIVFEAMGALIYFLTAGRLISCFLRYISKGTKRLIRAVFKKIGLVFGKAFAPIGKKIKQIFVNIAEIIRKKAFYSKIHLKRAGTIEYNSKVQSVGGGEHTGVVKAKIRKKE